MKLNAPGRFNHTTEQVPEERPTNTARFHQSGVVKGIITPLRKIYGNLKTHFMEGVCQSLVHDILRRGR